MPGNVTKTAHYALGGGIDVVTPALSVKAGRALALNNFEPWYNGGYRRIDGFERYDGRPKPSEQTYTGFEVSTAASLTVGDTVTGDTSGATGICIGIWLDDGTYSTDSIGVTKVTGTFVNGESCNTAAFTIDRDPTYLFAPSASLELDWRLAAADEYRDDILVVPGSGEVLGIWQRNAYVYAIRDNAGDTAGVLHLASTSGWTETGITMAKYIFFDAGGAGAAVALPAEGTVITGLTSSATGTVHRVVQLGGSTAANDAYGYLVLTAVTGGPFTDNEKLQYSATSFADADGIEATFSFAKDGEYKFINHNFFGGASTYRTYGVSGVGPAFEIDENNVVSPILFPKTAFASQPDFNTPYLVEEHRNYLFLAYPGGRFAHSVNGEPLVFDGFLGAAEFGIGDEITGMESVVGGVLAIASRRETRGLFGTTIADWELRLLAEKTGGKLGSIQKLDTIYALDDLGVTSLARTDKFGDFVGSTVSQLIQPLVSELKSKFTTSTIVRESNQYRMYFSDNTGIIMYVPNAGADTRAETTRTLVEFGFLVYPFPVNRIYNTEDENGVERSYFASTDGYVYEDRIGYSFDGTAIASACRLVFNTIGTPSMRKRFRRVVLELESQKPLALKVISDLAYGSEDSSPGNTDIIVDAGGGLWDVDNWDEFFFDGQTISTAVAGLTGTGTNIGLLMYNLTAKVRPFIMQGVTIHYDVRRLKR